MNEESDSYYYPKTIPPTPGGMKNCKIAADNYFYSQKRTFSNLYADARTPSITKLNLTPPPRRVLPPVPHFEDTYKKSKLNSSDNVNLVPQNPIVAFLMSQVLQNNPPSGPKACLGDEGTFIKKVIKVIPETAHYDELFAETKKSKTHLKYLSKLEKHIQVDPDQISPIKEEESDFSGHSSLSTSPSSSIEEEISPQHSLIQEQLDKKDEKKYQKFLELLNNFMEKLSIKNEKVMEKFKELTRLVIPNLVSHFKSKPFESVAAAVLLYACREVGYPITIKQIASVSDVKDKLINKCIYTIKEILPEDVEIKRFNAGEFIKVLAEKLGLDDSTHAAAFKIWVNIERLNFIKSIHAVTLASCCVKYACALSANDREVESIAVAAGITKMTLKNMFHFITPECGPNSVNDLKEL